MYAELNDGVIWLRSEYFQTELIKQIPGSRWHKDHKLWWVPVSWAACVSMRGIFKDELEIGPVLDAWARKELDERIGPCLELREAEDADLPKDLLPESLPKKGDIFNGDVVEYDWDLEPRQRAGVKYMATARRCLLGDGMGSGKTVQTITALRLLEREGKEPYPALIVAPNSMKRTWEKEFAIWSPNKKVVVIDGGAAKRRKQMAEDADVFIVNWDLLRSHSNCAGYGTIKLTDKEKEKGELNEMGLHTFVADEAHRAKNPKAQMTRAAWAVSWGCEFRFALTGTPLASTPVDTWSIMHMLEPSEWPSKIKFINRYAMQSWSNFGFMEVTGIKGEHAIEFFRILDPRFIRRPTKIVVPALKEKLPPQMRIVKLLPKQRKAYDEMRKDLLAELDGGILMATNPLTKMTRLVQLAAAFGEIDAEGNLRLSEPSCKLDAFDDILEELEPDDPVVVFAESRQLIELGAARWEKANIPFGLITGSVTGALRQKAVDEFQAGELKIIAATLGAGGEGLTLTRARHSVFLQRSFSLVKNLQAEDRVWRKGQMRQVQRIDIVSEDTIEDHIAGIGYDKEGRLEEVCRDAQTVKNWLAKTKVEVLG